MIEETARKWNASLLAKWKDCFGVDSVRYARNHAKIATIRCERFRLLLRGSMNLNFNARFEQFDLTEGGEDFDLVKSIEAELPVLPDHASVREIYAASKVTPSWSANQLSLFDGVKVWSK